MKLSSILVAGALTATAAVPAFAEEWTIDPTHTIIGFAVDHFGMSAIKGRFHTYEGEFVLDTENPANSSINITIDVASMDTGNGPRDDHFRAADFFEVETFPEATFTSTSVEITGDTTAEVVGDLTIKGVTKPVTLSVTLNGMLDDHPIVQGTQAYAGFTATTEFERADFGIDTFAGVGDTVSIDIEMEATGPNS